MACVRARGIDIDSNGVISGCDWKKTQEIRIAFRQQHQDILPKTVRYQRKKPERYTRAPRGYKMAAHSGIEIDCLRCGEPFKSQDRKANRICGWCKCSDDWQSGSVNDHSSGRQVGGGQFG